jgi:hypothetical protein
MKLSGYYLFMPMDFCEASLKFLNGSYWNLKFLTAEKIRFKNNQTFLLSAQ